MVFFIVCYKEGLSYFCICMFFSSTFITKNYSLLFFYSNPKKYFVLVGLSA